MQQQQIDRVVELMTQMAQGDTAAAFTLYREFGGVIRRVLRAHLEELHSTAMSDELDGLTLDAVMALFDAAPSWRPDGGAMPWTWAERRLRALVHAHIGQWADEFDHERHDREDPPASHTDSDDMRRLARVAGSNETVALLVEALRLVCSERDAGILVAVRAQAAAGDPSPANTVAAQLDMQPPAVRQAARRARLAVLRLAESDPRFAPLCDLPLLAP